jgi:glycosyltransferase EpsH
MALIHVVIPVYNAKKFLAETVASVLDQPCKDIDIVLVNDGSTDGSLAILEEYARKDDRIKIISQENKGLSEARNCGIEHTNGEWTMFVDSDDWIDLNTCERVVKIASEQNADLVLWAYCREFRNESLQKLYIKEATIWEENCHRLRQRIIGPVKEELKRADTLDSIGTIWGKLYKSSYIQGREKIRFTDIKNIGSAEDVLFNVAYAAKIKKAIYIPETLYHYRKGDSYTTVHKANLAKKWEQLYKEIEKEISRSKHKEEYKEALDNRIALGIIGLGLNEMYAKASIFEKRTKIKALINREKYKNALATLPLKYFPIHWKLFFFAVKKRHAWAATLMLAAIKKIITR